MLLTCPWLPLLCVTTLGTLSPLSRQLLIAFRAPRALTLWLPSWWWREKLYETLKDPVFWNISALKKSCMPVILSSVVQVNTLNSQKFTLAISTININDKCSWHLPQSYGRSRPIWQLRMWSARDQSRSTWCWKEAFCLIIHPFLILCLIDTRVQGWTLTVSLTVKYPFFWRLP